MNRIQKLLEDKTSHILNFQNKENFEKAEKILEPLASSKIGMAFGNMDIKIYCGEEDWQIMLTKLQDENVYYLVKR